MSELFTTGEYYSTTVDSTHLQEIQEDLLSESELIAYSINSDGDIDVLIDLDEFEPEVNLRYLH